MKSLRDYDPFSSDISKCLYEYYDKLREQEPVYEVAPEVFLVSSYQLIREVITDTTRFSSTNGAAFLNFQSATSLAKPTVPSNEIIGILLKGIKPRDTLLSADPPSHGRYREVVNKALSPQKITAHEPWIDNMVADLIRKLKSNRDVEFVSSYASIIPLRVLAKVVGLPQEMIFTYKKWADESSTILMRDVSRDEKLLAANAYVELSTFFDGLIEEARVSPGNNFIGELVTESDLDNEEIISILHQFIVAGQETVNYLLSSTILHLIDNPDLLEELRNDKSLIPNLIEESLRLDSPIQTLGRFATMDTIIGGVSIPKGARVMLMYGAGNRDECKFSESNSIDLNRPKCRQHLAFGAGSHFCVGAKLARAQTRIAIEHWISNTNSFGLKHPNVPIEYLHSFIFRAPLKIDLIVEFK